MSEANSTLDKDALYGDYRKSQEWKQKLFRKASHKALDIGDDDMNISPTTTIKNGFGWKEILSLGVIAGVFWLVWQEARPSSPASPSDSEYEVRFYDNEGKQIEIPRYQPKKVR